MPDDNVPAPVADTSPAAEPVNPTNVTPSSVVDPVVPATPAETGATADQAPALDAETPAEVAKKIGEAHNVLIALSSDPSVDEIAAAIGLSLYLDKLGKRATAIYSGQTPNALEFLKPEETFEDSVDTLQDFVIALNKEKADHLRYKLDGDYVKIFITPYKSRIGEEDLEFSYGDYNVDLVLALDVANGVDLDSALREHGRIMHDAVIINITTGNPGKLGEIEWSDKSASSVSEMIAKLLYSVKSKTKIEKEEATAFLTGIVAATNRFANANTTSETMRLSSKLIDSGANQQLVSKNITPDLENEMLSMGGSLGTIGDSGVSGGDPTLLDIEHGNEEGVDESKVVDTTVTEKESTLLDDLKAAEASLATAGAEVTDAEPKEPLKIDSSEADEVAPEGPAVSDGVVNAEPVGAVEPVGAGTPTLPEVQTEAAEPSSGLLGEAPAEGDGGFMSNAPEKVIQPTSDLSDLGNEDSGPSKYGQMLEDALAGANGVAPVEASAPVVDAPVVDAPVAVEPNPAAMGAPTVPTNPDINGVPEINYMPMPGDTVLPPPPTPPIADAGSVPLVEPIASAEPAAPGIPDVAPVEPATPTAPQATDPGAFKIPGM